jgi:hypothetical protein
MTTKAKKTAAEKHRETLIELATGEPINAYEEWNAKRKEAFHKAARSVAKQLAAALGWETGSYDIRTNLAGIAVLGETTLHGEAIYIQFGEGLYQGARANFMYRSCGGRRDSCGGPNRWMEYRELRDIAQAAEKIKRGVI